VFSHVFIGVGEFDQALRFYSALMKVLDLELRFCEPEKPWAGWHGPGRSRPLFVIGTPYNGQPHDPGNGQTIAFAACDRATVRACYHAALQHGGTCDGPPGLRPHYHAHYYGAYFRDPDGNKICVASHAAQGAE